MELGEEERIKATLLYNLRRKRVIGGVHTPFDTLTKGFPSHLGKEVKKAAKQLINKGILIAKPASYGLQVSINKDRIPEIEDFIDKVLGIKF